MHAARIATALLLAASTVFLSACELPGSGGETTATQRPAGTTQPEGTTTTPNAREQSSAPAIELQQIASGLDEPTWVGSAPDNARLLYVLERSGAIKVLQGRAKPREIARIDDLQTGFTEQGLLGLAFHPEWPQTKVAYLNYTDSSGDTIVQSRLGERLTAGDVLLRVEQPQVNHNGGHLAFGPDGLLYIGLGDGGGAGDPDGNAQDPDSLLGKMLRMDPLADEPAAQVWASGLRNPWRYSFDRATGDLWIADVGQGAWEEVNVVQRSQLASTDLNFGWNAYEGTHEFADTATSGTLVTPVHEYSHDDGSCSVTGGFVYRGKAIPELQGHYLWADYCQSWIRAARVGADGSLGKPITFEAVGGISSFGEDAAGELYVTSLGEGTVSRIVSAR